jgi:hypothetical protein
MDSCWLYKDTPLIFELHKVLKEERRVTRCHAHAHAHTHGHGLLDVDDDL